MPRYHIPYIPPVQGNSNFIQQPSLEHTPMSKGSHSLMPMPMPMRVIEIPGEAMWYASKPILLLPASLCYFYLFIFFIYISFDIFWLQKPLAEHVCGPHQDPGVVRCQKSSFCLARSSVKRRAASGGTWPRKEKKSQPLYIFCICNPCSCCPSSIFIYRWSVTKLRRGLC